MSKAKEYIQKTLWLIAATTLLFLVGGVCGFAFTAIYLLVEYC